MSKITLRYLNVTVCDYGPDKGTYSGEVKFAGEHGTVNVKLDHALSAEVLKLCAESMTRATKELADNLTAEVFEQAGMALLDIKPGQPPSGKDTPF
jgi:hypothetical protein